MGQIKKGAEMVMIVEAANPNWHDQNDSTKYPGNFLKRLGARHGKRRGPDGIYADLNMAFFDGHVALFPVEQVPEPVRGDLVVQRRDYFRAEQAVKGGRTIQGVMINFLLAQIEESFARNGSGHVTYLLTRIETSKVE